MRTNLMKRRFYTYSDLSETALHDRELQLIVKRWAMKNKPLVYRTDLINSPTANAILKLKKSKLVEIKVFNYISHCAWYITPTEKGIEEVFAINL